MLTRTGIDLRADQCRIVEAHIRGARSTPPLGVQVRAFATLLVGDQSPALTAELTTIRNDYRLPREAWVTVWGLQSVHQFVRLPPAGDGDLEALAVREARADLSPLEEQGGRLSVGLMVGGDVHVGTHRRRQVSLVAAPEAEIMRRIQPLLDAGFEVKGVATPALALAAVSRQQGVVSPEATAAYVALEAHATCLAIARDGVLLFAREIPWGYADTQEPVDLRLAGELRRSVLFFRQRFRQPVEAIVLCGGMTNLRSLTSPLGSALGVPVQTLDSLNGIDAEMVPEPSDAFRAAVAGLWPAIAVAADAGPRANLVPATLRAARARRREIVRSAAAFVLGVLTVGAWYSITKATSPNRSPELVAIERRVALLEPEAERLSALRRSSVLASSRQAAIDAFDSQGPRLARFLEALAREAPPEIVLDEIDAQADGPNWRTVVNGTALAVDPGVGQARVALLLRRLSLSPFVGESAQSPSFRVASGGRHGDADQPVLARAVPDGMSGVEFHAQFRVRK